MPRPALSRILIPVLLVLIVSLVVSVPFARAGEPASPRARGAAGFSSLADLLGRAWGSLVGLWMENGCILDPHGGCAAAPASENGCGADPSGGCRPGS
jgi:hypothetical protein